jgi:cysteinyl-tRNA synthetase
MTLKFFMYQAHYRNTLDISNDALIAAEKGFEKIIKLKNDINGLVESDESDFKADEWVKQCYDALNDDFNSPRLIAKLFDLYKIVQDIKIRNKHINSKNLKILKKFFPIFYSEILGLDDNTSSNVKYDAILNLILELREKERLNKNYKTSDYIRDQLQEFGVNINDKK